MDRNDNDAPRRNDTAYDDNRDNRMPENRQADNQEKSSGPDMRAFTVVDRGNDQKPFWREIGSANRHEDGMGLTVHTDATPHDGKIVLREQRREDFKEKRREGQSHSRSQDRNQQQSRD